MGYARELAELATAYNTGSPLTHRNKIINGCMRFDQRNAGASVTPADAQYTLDRWQSSASVSGKYSIQQNAGSVTPPAGFTNYLGITSLSAYSIGSTDYFGIVQQIEGYNIADLAWGTASAKTVTLSFWVRSSLTGTFGGVLRGASATRSYPFTYSIPTANTWTQISITADGPTSGTWLTTNGSGLNVIFNLGTGATYSGTAGAWASANYVSATGATSVVGTNGATFYITGVQLEAGRVATPFEMRSYGAELALCQRYFANTIIGTGYGTSTTALQVNLQIPVTMRATPTVTVTSPLTVTDGTANYTQSSASSGTNLGTINGGLVNGMGNFTGITQNRMYIINTANFNNPVTVSAEL